MTKRKAATKPVKKEKILHEIQPRLEVDLAVSTILPQPENYTRIKHSVNIGDLYAAMGAMKKYYDVTKRKVIVAQKIDMEAAYYAGAQHPTKNDSGVNVCMNQAMWQMCKPLVESQEYIHSFEKYEGQKIDLDFDVIRGKTFVNLPHGAIQQWIPLAFPDLVFDLSQPWIIIDDNIPKHITEQVKGKIIINFTERYRASQIEYFFLQHYAPDLVFAGTEKEHWLFCNRWQINMPRLEVSNFLELAYALKASRFMLGNQSSCWNLAESMKTPRILEICTFADNCQMMVGEHSAGYIYQVGLEYHFRRLYNILK